MAFRHLFCLFLSGRLRQVSLYLVLHHSGKLHYPLTSFTLLHTAFHLFFFPANEKAVSLYVVFDYTPNSWEDLRVIATNQLYRTELRNVVS